MMARVEKTDPCEAASAVIREYEDKYHEMLCRNADYSRYVILGEDIRMKAEEIEAAKAQRDEAFNAGNARAAVDADKKIAGLEEESRMMEKMLSGIDYINALSRDEKVQFSDEFNQAMQKSAAGKLLDDIEAALKTIIENCFEMENICSMVDEFHSRTEDIQRNPFSFYYPSAGEFSRAISFANRAASVLRMDD